MSTQQVLMPGPEALGPLILRMGKPKPRAGEGLPWEAISPREAAQPVTESQRGGRSPAPDCGHDFSAQVALQACDRLGAAVRHI